jgi:hypothetical protein
VITASVTDSGGLAASDTITLTVNASPTLTIDAPPDGAIVDEDQPVTFSGTAIDPEQGDISAHITWVSSKDGTLGTGASISASLTSRGKHTISATVTDSGGASAVDQTTIRVRKAR